MFSVLGDKSRTHRRWWSVVLAFYLVSFFPALAAARVASRFSFSAGEEYNDNIFFSEKKSHDLVTVLTPALHFLYQPQYRTDAFLTADLNTSAEIYPRHGELTNIGDRLSFRANALYPYSQRVTFHASDCLGRLGKARLGGLFDNDRAGSFGSVMGGGSSSRIPEIGRSSFEGGGGEGQCGRRRGLGGLVSGEPTSPLRTNEILTTGDTLENEFNFLSTFAYSQNLRFALEYNWNYTRFFDEGAQGSLPFVDSTTLGNSESSHEFEAQAGYALGKQHNLTAKYRVNFLRSRNGKQTVLHDFDLGDDFYSSRQIRLTPTLVLKGATGLSLGTGEGSLRLYHKLDVSLVKLWRTAIFSISAHRGLSGSSGISGASYTTTFSTQYTIQLTRRLTMFAAANYSMYDTRDSNFNTFQAIGGFQYWVTSWMSANLMYNYRQLDPGKIKGTSRESTILRTATIDGNSVTLSLSMHFDIWPNVGLARSVAANSQMAIESPVEGVQPGPAPEPAQQAPAANP